MYIPNKNYLIRVPIAVQVYLLAIKNNIQITFEGFKNWNQCWSMNVTTYSWKTKKNEFIKFQTVKGEMKESCNKSTFYI